jgi:hypothetical protein
MSYSANTVFLLNDICISPGRIYALWFAADLTTPFCLLIYVIWPLPEYISFWCGFILGNNLTLQVD